MTDPIDEEFLIDHLRRWLRDAHHEAAAATDQPGDAGDEVGLFRLVEEFTALRHEIKLQTKGSRDLREQTEALLPPLRQAIEHFRSVEPRESQAAWTAGKPLAKAMADLDEALERGRAELEKARRRLVDEAAAALDEALEASFQGQGWFRRRRTRAFHEATREIVRQRGPAAGQPLFDALIEGYGLIQTRLRRAMDAEQVQRIEAVGQPVDPERMIVIALVEDSGGPPNEVVDVIRNGYTWRGRVLRAAEVRAAPTTSSPSDGEPPSDPPDALDIGE